MAVFGGAGSAFGPVVGAFLLSGISEILSTEISSAASLFFGLVIVAAVLLMPRGLADIWRRFRKLGWRYFSESIKTYRL
jgi:branched-chain amino acid transport system permease protein